MADEIKKDEKKEEVAEVTESVKKDEKKEVAAEPRSKDEGETVELSAQAKKILDKIESLPADDKRALGLEIVKTLTVLELSKWVKAMEDEFGVSAAPVAAVGAVAAGASAEQEEEKTSFTIILSSFGEKKIQVIKEVRAVTSLGLKEAKDLVESAPTAVKEDIPKEEAEEIKKKIEAAGGIAEIK